MFSASKNILIYGGSFYDSHSPNHASSSGTTSGFERLLQVASPSAFHNSGERFDPPRCHPKTRLKVLTDIENWTQCTDGSFAPVMWVNGGAGVGKSAIAQTMAERLAQEGRLLASYFFSRTDPFRNNADHLVASIAYQASLYLPEIKDHVVSAIERNPLIFRLSLEAQVASLITAPLRNLDQHGFFTSGSPPWIIVIDGLDECNDHKVQVQVLNAIASALRHGGGPSPIAFLISSRRERDLLMTFSSGFMANIYTSLELDDIYADDDIRFFLEDEFEEVRKSHPLRAYLPSSWPNSEHLERLVRKSSGQFIYASTVVKYVSSVRHRPDKRLEVILGLHPLTNNENPFAELDALYTHVLSFIETDKITVVVDILAFCILAWTHPDVAVIEQFLKLDPGDIETSLWDLGSVVQIVNSKVRVLHASLRDFLDQESRSKKFHIDTPAKHEKYATRYLEILRSSGDVSLSNMALLFFGYHCIEARVDLALREEVVQLSFSSLYTKFHLSPREDVESVSAIISNFMTALAYHPSLGKDVQIKADEYFTSHLEAYYTDPQHTFLVALIAINADCVDDYLVIGFFDESYNSLTYLSYYRPFYDHLTSLDKQHLEIQLYLARSYSRDDPYRKHLYDFLQNQTRSGSLAFDGRRYATAALHCLKVLCDDDEFFVPFTDYSEYAMKVRASRPLFWRKVLRPRTRRLMSFQAKVLRRRRGSISSNAFPYMQDLVDDFLYSRAYGWALRCLRRLLRRSAKSEELVEFASKRSFSVRSLDWPRESRLTRNSIYRYLARCSLEHGGISE